MQRNGIAGVAADGCFRYGKIAVAVLQRQLPFVSSVFWNFGQASVRLAAHGGGCKEYGA